MEQILIRPQMAHFSQKPLFDFLLETPTQMPIPIGKNGLQKCKLVSSFTFCMATQEVGTGWEKYPENLEAAPSVWKPLLV